MNRRIFLKSSAVLLANAALMKLPVPSFAAPAVLGKKEMTIGVLPPTHCSAPLLFAYHKGFYEKRGLRVKLIPYPTIQEIAKDMLSGKLAMGQMTVPAVFAMHLGAEPFKNKTPFVMPMILGVHGSNLMVRKALHLTKPTDIKGKCVATHSTLGIHYLLTRLFLERNGIDAKRDTNLLIVPVKELPSALEQGKVDIFMMPEPVNAITESTGAASPYMLNKYIWRYHPCCGLSMTRAAFERDQEIVKGIVSATAQASRYINREEHRKELVSLLVKTPFGFSELPPEALTLAFSYERSAFQPFPYQSTAMLALELMQDYKLIPQADARKVAREVFLSDLARECLKSIGEKAPAKNFRPEILLGHVKEFKA